MTNPNDDLDALFNDVSAAIAGSDSNKLNELMTAETEESQTTATEEEASAEDATAEETDATPQDAESVSETSQEQEESEEQTTEQTSEEPGDIDELRKKLESLQKENHSLRSQAGRVPHVQRKIQELDKKLAELAAQAPSSRPSAVISEKLANKLSSIKSADPELADVLQEIISTVGASQDEIVDKATTRDKETLALLREQELRQHQEYEAAQLLELYPNAKDVFVSDSWKEWKAAQSKAVQALADGDTAGDVAKAFKLYEQDMLELYPELRKPATPAVPEKAKQIEEERRNRQTRSASVPTSSSQATRQTLPDDPDKLFDYFSEKIRKERWG